MNMSHLQGPEPRPHSGVRPADAQRPPRRHEEARQEEEGQRRRQLALRLLRLLRTRRQLIRQLPLLRHDIRSSIQIYTLLALSGMYRRLPNFDPLSFCPSLHF